MRASNLSLQFSAVCIALSAGMSMQVLAQNKTPTQAQNNTQQLPKGSIAPQAPLTAQERLDAIRQSLVDASLQNPTRVSTTTWIDPQGSLRDNSTFKNALDVQGVKVLGYERDDAGQAKARLQFPSNMAAQQAASKNETPRVKETGLQGAIEKFSRLMGKTLGSANLAATAEVLAQGNSCTQKVGARMNHLVSLDVQVDANASALVLQTLLPHIQAQWVQTNVQSGKANAWRAVNNLPAASMANSMTAYERALIGNRPDTLPWQAVLKVKTESVKASSLEAYLGAQNPASFLTLDFQLVGTDGQAVQFEDSATLNLAFERSSWAAPKMNAASVAAIQDQLQAWRGAAEDWLNCQQINPVVTAAMGQLLEINAGALSGVRKGDEWLLANPARFPSELMSREGAPQTLLASVQSVTPYGSQLVVLAGPAQAVQANWRAWPTETLLKEPSVLPSSRGAVPSKRPAKAPVSENANFTLSPY
jgi:hypothetical protein